MKILLTNDDGIFAPGLAAMRRELERLGEVTVVAPATEQSGVSHSITFLTPLVCKQSFDGDELRGWAVEGSPADCVKLAVSEFFDEKPDLVVSGINGGLNSGINVMYSGTVAAAIEGAFFGITSIAVSLEYEEHPNMKRAAAIGRDVIEQILEHNTGQANLYSVNIPLAALSRPAGLKVVPVNVQRGKEEFIRRKDPRGRNYYWSTVEPLPESVGHETDMAALNDGFVTVTPLKFDMNEYAQLEQMQTWGLKLPQE